MKNCDPVPDSFRERVFRECMDNLMRTRRSLAVRCFPVVEPDVLRRISRGWRYGTSYPDEGWIRSEATVSVSNTQFFLRAMPVAQGSGSYPSKFSAGRLS
jgi:hypothetical protein